MKILMTIQINRSGLLSSEIEKQIYLKIKKERKKKKEKLKRKMKIKRKQIKRTQDILIFTVVKVMVEWVVNVLVLLKMVIVALGQN